MTLDEISRIYAKGIAEHVRAGYVIDDMLLQNSVHHLRFKQSIREAIDKAFVAQMAYVLGGSDAHRTLVETRKALLKELGLDHE